MDNYSIWLHHERQQDEWLDSRPVCDHCGHPIQEQHYYMIENKFCCQDCLDDTYRREIDD